MQQAGYTGTLIPVELMPEFDTVLTRLKGYASRFVADVTTTEETDKLEYRNELWLNKGLEEPFFLGQLLADLDKVYAWELGPTEHCISCLAASGQIHTARDLLISGIYPRSRVLACGGWRCQCNLFEVNRNSVGNLGTIPTSSELPFITPPSRLQLLIRRARGIFGR